MPTRYRLAAAAAVAVLALLGLGACSSSGSGSAGAAASSARAHASSIAANPTVSSDVNAAEALLLANLQKEVKDTPAHPIAAAGRAVHDTFPTGNTSKIVSFGVSKATITMVHSKDARHAWVQAVVLYALANGGSTAAPGSAVIPGVTSPATPASPSTSAATTTGGNG